jgi:hypothetical protein
MEAKFLQFVADRFDRGDIEFQPHPSSDNQRRLEHFGHFPASRSSRSRVGNELASLSFTVTLFLPSTCRKQVASGLVILTGTLIKRHRQFIAHSTVIAGECLIAPAGPVTCSES